MHSLKSYSCQACELLDTGTFLAVCVLDDHRSVDPLSHFTDIFHCIPWLIFTNEYHPEYHKLCIVVANTVGSLSAYANNYKMQVPVNLFGCNFRMKNHLVSEMNLGGIK